MVTKPSLPLSLSPSLSLLQPYHVLHRYGPNHSLAKQWCTQHPSFLSFRLSACLSCLSCQHLCYPCSVSSRHLLPPSPSCSDCEWNKHELSHASYPTRLGAAEEMMHPVDNLRSKRLGARDVWQAGGILGNKQRGFGVFSENKLRNLPGLKSF